MRVRKQDGMTVQTVICSKERFETKEEANAWIREHDFKIGAGAPDETSTSWRYRQREPSEFQDGTFRTIELTDGVSAVVGRLKETKESEMKTKQTEAEERGAELLLSLNLEPANVQAFEFAIDKFKNTASAKAWAKNHGFAPAEPPRQMRDCVVLRVRAEADFEPIALRRSAKPQRELGAPGRAVMPGESTQRRTVTSDDDRDLMEPPSRKLP